MNRQQYKLMNRATRLLRRCAWGVDSRSVLVQSLCIVDIELTGAGLDMRPSVLEWALCVLPPAPDPFPPIRLTEREQAYASLCDAQYGRGAV